MHGPGDDRTVKRMSRTSHAEPHPPQRVSQPPADPAQNRDHLREFACYLNAGRVVRGSAPIAEGFQAVTQNKELDHRLGQVLLQIISERLEALERMILKRLDDLRNFVSELDDHYSQPGDHQFLANCWNQLHHLDHEVDGADSSNWPGTDD